MALYREHRVNPLAGCFPMLLQMPILISLYYAITESRAKFTNATWLWIGSPISFHFPNILATDLAKSDLVLLAAYVISMYFTVRSSSPALDAQQAKQQRIMAFVSPALTGYFGFRYRWPSALLIYWLGLNVFTIFQQRYMLKTPDGLNARSWSFLVWAILSCLLPSLANPYTDGWLMLGWIVFTVLLFASINGALEYSLSAARLRQR
jgi:YidC/Oxa1 family membrane protein insertase